MKELSLLFKKYEKFQKCCKIEVGDGRGIFK